MIIVRLDSPGTRTSLRFQRLVRGRIKPAFQREIGKALLGHIWMFVPLVGTERIERADAENANHTTEDVGLFEVQVDQFLSPFLNEIDRIF